jgi:hypothetical protein
VLQDFHFWLVIFNYEAPCGSADAPPLRHVLQVPPSPPELSASGPPATLGPALGLSM